MEQICIPHPRGRRHCTEEEWALARLDYLDGLSAPQVARAYGVGVSTLRERAAREGWRREDQPPPDPHPVRLGLEDLTEDDEDIYDMAQTVWRRVALAIKTGDRLGARAWLRMHKDLLPTLHDYDRDMIDAVRVDIRRPNCAVPSRRHPEAAPDADDAPPGPGPNPPAGAPPREADAAVDLGVEDVSMALIADAPAPIPLDGLDGDFSESAPGPGSTALPAEAPDPVAALHAWADADPETLPRPDRRIYANAWNLRLRAEAGTRPWDEVARDFAATLAEAGRGPSPPMPP